MAGQLRHLDLLRLLRSRIRFDLPGGRELTMARIPEESPTAGTSVSEFYRQLSGCDFEIITIGRTDCVSVGSGTTESLPSTDCRGAGWGHANRGIANHVASTMTTQEPPEGVRDSERFIHRERLNSPERQSRRTS